MLIKINEGGVESTDGYSIQIKGPSLLEYRENEKKIEIDVGYDFTQKKIYIYASTVNQLSNQEKVRMTNNIKEAVKILRGNFEVV